MGRPHKLDRRYFLKSGAIALAGLGSQLVVPRFLARAAAESAATGKTLVVVFLRGAADGLNMVVPHGERDYYRMRPSIAIPQPRKGKAGTALDLDGRFGLHPELKPLHELFETERLGVVVAAGSPDTTRSHFDAQDFMESGTPGVKSTRDGWLNRYLQALGRHEDVSRFRAVSLTGQLPRILAGSAPALAIPELSRFGLESGRYSKLVRSGLESLYAADDPLLTPTARETFEAVDQLRSADPSRFEPQHGAAYPQGAFGDSMRQTAQLIKAGVGLEIAFAEMNGWDTHVNQGGSRGQQANLLRQLGGGLAAFSRDLGDRMEDVVVVTLSEFGRTAAENGSRGTDHGHANSIFVLGGGVRGGAIYGRWPGLAPEQLNERRDLALTTDFRDVLAELLQGHLHAPTFDRIFPGHRVDRGRFLGLFQA